MSNWGTPFSGREGKSPFPHFLGGGARGRVRKMGVGWTLQGQRLLLAQCREEVPISPYQVGKAWSFNLTAIGAAAAVGDQVNAKLPLRHRNIKKNS